MTADPAPMTPAPMTEETTTTVLVPGVLRAECEGAKELRITSGPTLGSLLDTVADRWPRLHRRVRDEQGQIRRFVNIYVDGQDCREIGRLDAPLVNDGEVQILPSVAGG